MGPRAATQNAFDRTYEGLKRRSSAVSSLGLSSFDRTYEGLKRMQDQKGLQTLGVL